MATKLYYAIDYRRMHTGIHGLLIFEEKISADKAMKSINAVLREVDKLDRKSNATLEERQELQLFYDSTMEEVFNNANKVEEEINYKDIVWAIRYGKNVKEYKYKLNGRTIRVINTSVDLYV